MSSARFGFYREELDYGFQALKLLLKPGVVWQPREPFPQFSMKAGGPCRGPEARPTMSAERSAPSDREAGTQQLADWIDSLPH